ncbi:aldo/keto reductase [Stappia sediminis]|uniref:aldo/keto reductase n=1 Tax=Stappia sediminis TaxID=2692190 RepID=UPI0028A5C3F8|nr:aldo/keto reductase [Stappia sediminis]
MESVTIKDTVIPKLGLGTWRLADKECRDMVLAALEDGWRHIDTAAMYANEAEVGKGIRSSGVPRDDVFLTTKVWYDKIAPEDMIRSCEDSLDRLGLDYADLILIHWPNPRIPLKESIEGLLELKARGWVKAIGVSNFTSGMMREAQGYAGGALVANQVEYHPLLSQKRVLEAAEELDMAITAYAPIARGRVSDVPVIRDIAKKHGKTEAQVALRWLIQQERVIAVPKTARRERLRENAGALTFELMPDEMDALFALGSASGRTVNMDWAPKWDSE